MVIVRASQEHSHLIWEWRNDPLTKAMSTTTEEVPWTDHDRWFASSLVNPNRRLYVGLLDEIPFAMGRFDVGQWTATSINLAAGYRGKGLSAKFLQAVLNEFEKEFGPRLIYADIKASNVHSIRMCERCGYVVRGIENGFVRMEHYPLVDSKVYSAC